MKLWAHTPTSLLGSYILLNTLFSRIRSLCSSLSMKDHILCIRSPHITDSEAGL